MRFEARADGAPPGARAGEPFLRRVRPCSISIAGIQAERSPTRASMRRASSPSGDDLPSPSEVEGDAFDAAVVCRGVDTRRNFPRRPPPPCPGAHWPVLREEPAASP